MFKSVGVAAVFLAATSLVSAGDVVDPAHNGMTGKANDLGIVTAWG